MNGSVEAQLVGQAVAIFFYLLGGIYLAVRIWQSFRPQPPLRDQFMSRADGKACREGFSDRIVRLEKENERQNAVVAREIKELRSDLSAKVGATHARIDALSKSFGSQLGRLTGTIETYMQVKGNG